ncbi:Tubulin polyglutamylase complex subunit 1, partial [Stegodyphus mimosarum]
MEEENVDSVLQHALSALLEIKPNDPIRFLAEHFQMECETNLVAKAVHLLQDMTVYHPAVEDRLMRAYNTISGYSSDDGLTGDIYSDLLTKLIGDLPVHQKDTFVQHMKCQSPEFVPYDIFRAGVLASILLNQFIREVKTLFAKLCIENQDSAPTYLCKKALRKISKCLTENLKKSFNDSEAPNSLGIAEFSSPIRTCLPKNLPTVEYVKMNTFLSEAVEIFLRDIPKL